MDIKDQLERHKKERDLRSRRAHSVEEAWNRIDKDGGLTVKEKLEKLINLTDVKKTKPEPKKSFGPPPREREREPIQFFENPYPLQTKYGKNRIDDSLAIKGEILSYLSKNEEFSGLDMSTALLLDLETTGLAGGTGTVPFLIGMGYFRDGKFRVAQYFLSEIGEEERLIRELGRFFKEMGFQSVVTYNGKAFDLPLLETRFIMHRERFTLSELPHLDLLFSARSLWKHKHESCRLFHLAQQIVEADRAEDIPSAEIPFRYFDYLRGGDFSSLIEPILYHNQEDILSLLGLLISAAKMFEEDRGTLEDDGFDAMDMFGVGKVFESVGDVEKSVAFFERALAGNLPEALSVTIKRKLTFHFKKNADWDKAVSLWQDMSSLEDRLFCCRELAIYYEHKAKRYEDAKKAAEEGLALAIHGAPNFQHDFEHRLERLNRKILKPKKGKAGPSS